jgi:hypothetical protein
MIYNLNLTAMPLAPPRRGFRGGSIGLTYKKVLFEFNTLQIIIEFFPFHPYFPRVQYPDVGKDQP